MKKDSVDQDQNLRPSNLSENSSYRLGRKELYLLLLLFIAGFAVDYWFNHHQLRWQLLNGDPKASILTPLKTPQAEHPPI